MAVSVGRGLVTVVLVEVVPALAVSTVLGND